MGVCSGESPPAKTRKAWHTASAKSTVGWFKTGTETRVSWVNDSDASLALGRREWADAVAVMPVKKTKVRWAVKHHRTTKQTNCNLRAVGYSFPRLNAVYSRA